MNGKNWFLSKTKRLIIQQMDPCWLHIRSYDVIFKMVPACIMTSSSSPKYNFCVEISKSSVLFSHN